jgi:hypothetical protein
MKDLKIAASAVAAFRIATPLHGKQETLERSVRVSKYLGFSGGRAIPYPKGPTK